MIHQRISGYEEFSRSVELKKELKTADKNVVQSVNRLAALIDERDEAVSSLRNASGKSHQDLRNRHLSSIFLGRRGKVFSKRAVSRRDRSRRKRGAQR